MREKTKTSKRRGRFEFIWDITWRYFRAKTFEPIINIRTRWGSDAVIETSSCGSEVLDCLRLKQKCFQLLRFSSVRVRDVRAHALRYERKSDIEPEQRTILKRIYFSRHWY